MSERSSRRVWGQRPGQARRFLVFSMSDRRTGCTLEATSNVHPVFCCAPNRQDKTPSSTGGNINDIAYGTEFPNSFLDITYPDDNTETDRPTLFYFHGGVFLAEARTWVTPWPPTIQRR